MNNKNASNNEYRIAVTCFKLLAGAFAKYLDKQQLTELFSSVKRIFEQTYVLKYDPEDELWEFLPDYLQALASFMCFGEFNSSDFVCLQKGVINMIRSFPHLSYALQYGANDGMAMVCFYMMKTEYFDVFMENIVYQGKLFLNLFLICSNKETVCCP